MPEHLLSAILEQEPFINTLQDTFYNYVELSISLENYLTEEVETIPDNVEYELGLSVQLSSLLQHAYTVTEYSSAEELGVPHLIQGLLQLEDSWACHFLKEAVGGDLPEFLSLLITHYEEAELAEEAGGVQSPDEQEKTEPWRNYVTCLNDRLADHNPLIGREMELERTIQVLCRKEKNNPLHVGEPGVGKTALAYGLAARIEAGNVPERLAGFRIYELDLGSLLAGTQYRGDFEKRLKSIMEGIGREGNAIVYIDEIHNLIGAGRTGEGSMDASNMLKPYLETGAIRFIGSTTYDEYNRYFARSKGLVRRFQQIDILEPNIEEAIHIVEGLKEKYETYHGVTYEPDVIPYAVKASARYISDRFLPDKAIDLIDEACSDLNLHDKNINRRMELRREIEDYDKERELLQGAEEPDFERLAELKSLTIKAQTELDALCAQGDPQLSMDNLARVIELWTKIPASRIREDEFRRLSELDKRLKEHIVGQDEAVEAVAAAIRRNRVGISPKHKPVSFIFVGPTGVGKTELVKQLAQDLFNSPDALIRLDMSEFMEKHSVSRIVGSPPGYVGYDEAGQLTEKIRRKPYAVILFDEIEKAHPDVMNVLLQILDDGEITDSHGRKVNFENTVIVMTSNAGSERKEGTVGFGHTVNEQNRDRAMKALGEFLRPEFLNRVDEVICFNRLDEKNFAGIAHIMLDELQKSLEDKGLHFTWDENVENYLVKKSYSATYGARNLRRTIQKELEDVMAAQIIDSYEHPVTQIHASMEDGKLVVRSL